MKFLTKSDAVGAQDSERRSGVRREKRKLRLHQCICRAKKMAPVLEGLQAASIHLPKFQTQIQSSWTWRIQMQIERRIRPRLPTQCLLPVAMQVRAKESNETWLQQAKVFEAPVANAPCDLLCITKSAL